MNAYSPSVLAVVVSWWCCLGCGAAPPPAPRAPEVPVSSGGAGPQTAPTASPPHSTGRSYEAALEEPEDQTALAGEPELSDADLSKPMKNPTFLQDCGVEDSMHVTVRVALRDGAAIGVTVQTTPDDATKAECVDKAVRSLAWPATKRRDSFTTAY